MPEFQKFVTSIIRSQAQIYLLSGVVLPIASILFWLWFTSDAGTSIVLPRILIIMLLLFPIISPLLLWMWFNNRQPEQTKFYKLLFKESSSVKSYSIAGTVITLYRVDGGKVEKLNLLKSVDLQIFIKLLNQNFPNLVEVK